MRTLSILLITAATMLSSTLTAQNFDRFENRKGVTSAVFTKQMFKLMSKLDLQSQDKDMKAYIELIENLDDIKVFVTQDKANKAELKSEVDSYLKSTKLELLMKVNGDSNNVLFYIKPGKTDDFVDQLFMYVNSGPDNSESVVMMINGRINLNEISELTNKMNVPGAESLNNLKDK